ncbi:glycosyltransferase [Ralstonia sp. 25C]|uniref:glycosyltransferase n=1 Tax=Ralstonia sp. 25C TaxID=3447363 RepID=UPI003F74B791
MDSVLWQDIDQNFEIVVADDALTDSTRAIIREYVGRDPRVQFRFLPEAPNMGITRNYQRGFAAIDSEYVAVLEGDDIWCSPTKLSRQLAFLDAHRECVLCGSNYFVYSEDESRYTERVPASDGFRYLSSRDLIADNLIGNFSTCLYRVSALRNLPSALFDLRAYDWAVNITIGRQGLIGFLDAPLSIYRIHGAGSWSLLTHRQKLTSQLEVIPQYDAVTDQVFHAEFEALAVRLRAAGAGGVEVAVLPAGVTLRRVVRGGLRLVMECLPPVAVTILRWMVPPICKRVVRKAMGGLV